MRAAALDRAAAASLFAWAAWSGRLATTPGSLGPYALDGEALLHAVPGGFVSYRMPLSGLLAALLTHAPWLQAAAAPAAFAALACLAVALASRLAPSRLPLAAAAFALALLDWNWRFPETPLAVMLLCAALAAAWSADSRGLRRPALLACLLGSTFLFRSTLAFLPPLLALAELVDGPAAPRRERAARALVLLLLPYVFLLPWVDLNWLLSGRFVLFEAGQASSNLVTGALGLVETVEGDWSALLRGEADPASPSAVLGWAAREALSHPGRTLLAVASRLGRFLEWNGGLLAAALAAAWVNRDSRAVRRVLLMILYFVAAHAAMSVERRYFLPLRPLLAALALAGAARLAGPPRRAPRAWAPALAASAAALLAAGAFAEAVVLRYAWVTRSGATRAQRLERELARRPGDAGLSLMRGLDRWDAGDCRGAAEDLEAVLDGRSFAHRRAWCLAMLGDEAALLGLDPLEVEPAALSELRLLQAHVLLRRGRREQARARLLESAGSSESARLVRGGARDERRAAGLTRLVSEPGLVAALPAPPREKAALLGELSGLLDGSAQARAAMAEAWVQTARAAARAGERALALDCLRRAEPLAGQGAARRVALAYQDAGEHRRAARRLEELLAQAPGDAGLHSDLGVALFLAGDISRSEAMLERAVSLDPDHPSARESLEAVRSSRRR